MERKHKCEFICAAADHDFWLNWLLEQQEGLIDVMPIRRYGILSDQLARHEQVKGYADYFRFSLWLTAEAVQTIKQQANRHNHPIEVTVLVLND